MLLESLTSCVDRRETLVTKTAILATAKQIKGPSPQMNKTMQNKKVQDLKMKLKKMKREETELKRDLQAQSDQEKQLDQELGRNSAFLDKIQESILEMEAQIEDGHRIRDTKLALILQLQTR
jgi:chromosome segregation ATPase